MKDLILEKLGNSVATLQRVMVDDALLCAVVEAAEATGKAMLAGRKLMVAGNGGSAADSQHLVAEFARRGADHRYLHPHRHRQRLRLRQCIRAAD